MRRPATFLIATALLVILAVGCGAAGEPAPTAGGSPAAPPLGVDGSPAEPSAAENCRTLRQPPEPVNVRGQPAATPDTVVVAADFFFAPTCLTAPPGTVVRLAVRNDGRFLHNINMPGMGIDIDVSPGQAATVQIVVPPAPLRFVCKYHASSEMVGILVPTAP